MARETKRENCRFCSRPISVAQMGRHLAAKHPDEDPESPFVMTEVDAPAHGPRPGRRVAPAAPDGITGKGRVLWDGVVLLYDLRPDELRILEDACREAVLIDRLDRRLRGEGGLFVQGSRGQTRISPVVSEIRQHRATLARMLNSLSLPDDGDRGAAAAPALTPEEQAAARSVSARKAANARWRRG